MAVTETWREFFLAWAETDQHATALETAQTTIATALSIYRKPYVAWSGGKDSTAMLHLILQQTRDVMVYHWDFGPYKMPRAIFAEVMGMAEALGVTPRLETSTDYQYRGRRSSHVFERRFFREALPRLAGESYDLAFVGIRAQESSGRRCRIREGVWLTEMPECWPLASWTWQDVWAYTVTQGLPYVSVYDARATLAGYENARFSTMFDPDLFHLGTESPDKVLHWRLRCQR